MSMKGESDAMNVSGSGGDGPGDGQRAGDLSLPGKSGKSAGSAAPIGEPPVTLACLIASDECVRSND
jgi:hypothetical protein